MTLYGFYNKITRRPAGKLVKHSDDLIPLQKDLQFWGLDQQFGVLRVRVGRYHGKVYTVSEPADVPPPARTRG